MCCKKDHWKNPRKEESIVTHFIYKKVKKISFIFCPSKLQKILPETPAGNMQDAITSRDTAEMPTTIAKAETPTTEGMPITATTFIAAGRGGAGRNIL